MGHYNELSDHDKKLVDKIRKLDEYGYIRWCEISHLADQLEDEETKKFWNDVCKHYNHMEEASVGLL